MIFVVINVELSYRKKYGDIPVKIWGAHFVISVSVL